ncbi:MAG: FAD-dependent oxidoreductase, partial [Bacteroidota bacterium]
KAGVFVYRTIEDLNAIMAYGEKLANSENKKAAVLGGGLLGLEAAKAVMDMGLDPYVVEFASRLMPRQLDDAGANILKAIIEELGIKVLTNKNTKCIGGNGKMTHLSFADGANLDAQMLVISAGIRPRDELAKKCGLEIGERGGVIVNNKMQTSDPDIYAIGEVALYRNQIYGLVAPGYEMAEVALEQILGGEKEMQGEIDMSTKLKLIGTDVASFGDAFGEEACRTIVLEDKYTGIYKRINVTEDGERLLGGMLVGDAEDYNMLLQIAQNGMALPPNPEDLILGARGGEGSIGSVLDFPDSAVICSCENVSKGDILHAVTEEGCENLKAVSKLNKACTGCGGCKPMVKDLIEAALKSMGKTVKTVICEHFQYNRQELYDIIKVKGIKTYDEALDILGKGDGCETSKNGS